MNYRCTRLLLASSDLKLMFLLLSCSIAFFISMFVSCRTMISNIIMFVTETDKDLSYDHLASGLKLALEKDKTALDADRLQSYTGNFSSIRTSCII